jgi:large subunit ribosomal protein L29
VNVQEMRGISDDQLVEELDNSYRSLQNLRFRLATKQLTNTSELRTTKKVIARLLTVKRARELTRG